MTRDHDDPVTYPELFQRQFDGASITRIEIPRIQRDYAQGRQSQDVREKTRKFVKALFDALEGPDRLALEGPDRLDLNFIFGQLESGAFRPLDGQQRLTALFLLHWYLASAAGEFDCDAPWTRFSYATRASARRFCEELGRRRLDIPLRGDRRPSDWVKDQPWYHYLWNDDPTVKGMLEVVDAIHGEHERRELHADDAWRDLNDSETRRISFYVLPLSPEQLALGEAEFYIKMNARGKPLTEFEEFKAGFTKVVEQHDPVRAEDLAKKLDGQWTDLMWEFRGDNNLVDDEFMAYIGFITQICEFRRGYVKEGDLADRAAQIFGGEDPLRAKEDLDLLFDAFRVWESRDQVESVFDSVFSPPGDHYNTLTKVVVRFRDTPIINLFEQCCHQAEDSVTFTLADRLYLYAVLLYLIHESEDFPRRVRRLRNLVGRSDPPSTAMPGLVESVERLILDGDLDAVSFNRTQVQEEKAKDEFLERHPELSAILFRLEDHRLLRGTLRVFDLDPAKFAPRADAFEAAFADNANLLEITGALLAVGDYSKAQGASWAEKRQFGSTDPDPGREWVWRDRLLTAARYDDPDNPTGRVLAEFLDRVGDGDILERCKAISRSFLDECEAEHRYSWRYYLVRYPEMRKAKRGIYYLDGDNEAGTIHSICMLNTGQFNGKYRDAILHQMWLCSEIGDKAEVPWVRGYPWHTRRQRALRLTQTETETTVKCVLEGFEIIDISEETRERPAFVAFSERERIDRSNDTVVVKIDQWPDGIDRENRVEKGAALLKALA